MCTFEKHFRVNDLTRLVALYFYVLDSSENRCDASAHESFYLKDRSFRDMV